MLVGASWFGPSLHSIVTLERRAIPGLAWPSVYPLSGEVDHTKLRGYSNAQWPVTALERPFYGGSGGPSGELGARGRD